MQNTTGLINDLKSGKYNNSFLSLYNEANLATSRYIEAINKFVDLFGDGDDVRIFSAPGRTEIGGNHTDHQNGCVLAGAINLDIIAVAKKTDTNVIRIKSEGYDMDVVNLDVLTPLEEEVEHAPALIRGVAARFKELGYEIGGFDAYTTSKVLKGSGLSSSAAFEVMVCTLLNHLYNKGKMDPVQAAIISQYAENHFFKKPCGLMDQMACSLGGFVGIDFKDSANPVVEKIDFDFSKVDHSLCIVDSGGCHADLTDDYASIPAEMKQVASFFNCNVLREVNEEDFYKNLPALKDKVSHRAVLRAIHFFNDNKRAVELKEALKAGNFDLFLDIINKSGRSSLSYLQNVFSPANHSEQGLTLALALTEKILNGKGAFRVHGGGFAGTIQAFVPNQLLDSYKAQIEAVFGEGNCYVLNIRSKGGIEVTPNIIG